MAKPITIAGQNAGPIRKSFKFTLDYPGVWVCSAPNGTGKSLLAEDLQKAAAGKGQIKVSDGETKGYLEVGGARVTFGRQTKHGGEFQIKNLEGSFDLGKLVDPGVANPESADRARMAVLVQIAGVVGDPALFKAIEAFADYDQVCDAEVIRTDLVEMAAKVKARYEAESRSTAEKASAAKTKAATLMAPASELNMMAETNAAALQAAYDEARDALVKAEARAEEAEKQKEAMREAQENLKAEEATYAGPTVEEAKAEFDASLERQSQINKQIALLQQQLEVVKEKTNTANERLKAANEHQKVVDSATRVIKAGTIVPPSDAELEQLKESRRLSSEALELGVKVRSAAKDLYEGQRLQAEAEQLELQSARLRETAKATEQVLSAAIQSERFKVAVIDESTRLVVEHSRGLNTLYHELSHGEKCRLAVAEGCDLVGDGGILVLEQEFWESIDAFERPGIDQKAVEGNVFIWAPEATRNVEDGREMLVRKYESVTA